MASGLSFEGPFYIIHISSEIELSFTSEADTYKVRTSVLRYFITTKYVFGKTKLGPPSNRLISIKRGLVLPGLIC